ncbi:hypothetical protein C8R44DRAFT_736563 [Mycena epipterygia]|nr:hypothetical protein C8R44DRAFT_736563 [Mycena epipterygia]
MFTKVLLTFTLASLAVGRCYGAPIHGVDDGVGARSDGSGNICPDCVNPKIIEVRSAALDASVPADGVGARSDGSGNICPDCVNPKLIEVGSFSGTPSETIAAPEASASPQGVGARSDGSGNICPDCVNDTVLFGNQKSAGLVAMTARSVVLSSTGSFAARTNIQKDRICGPGLSADESSAWMRKGRRTSPARVRPSRVKGVKAYSAGTSAKTSPDNLR